MSNDTTEGYGAYECMPRKFLADGRWALHAVEPGDIESIRCWRNAQIDVLRQSNVISTDQQIDYYNRCIWPEKSHQHPRNVLLMYLQDDTPIGYGGLVHIAWEHRRAEVSFLLDPGTVRSEIEVRKLFATWLGLMKRLAFHDLGLLRLCTETYASRPLYISVLEECGFEHEGTLRDHVLINNVPTDSLIHGCLANINRAKRELV